MKRTVSLFGYLSNLIYINKCYILKKISKYIKIKYREMILSFVIHFDRRSFSYQLFVSFNLHQPELKMKKDAYEVNAVKVSETNRP